MTKKTRTPSMPRSLEKMDHRTGKWCVPARCEKITRPMEMARMPSSEGIRPPNRDGVGGIVGCSGSTIPAGSWTDQPRMKDARNRLTVIVEARKGRRNPAKT